MAFARASGGRVSSGRPASSAASAAHFVGVAAHCILGAVGDNEWDFLAAALFLGQTQYVLAFGSETNAERRFQKSGHCGQNVGGRLEHDLQRRRRLLGLLLVDHVRGVIGDGRYGDEVVLPADASEHGIGPLRRRGHIDAPSAPDCHMSVSTGRPDNAWKVMGVTKRMAAGVTTTSTATPDVTNKRVISAHL